MNAKIINIAYAEVGIKEMPAASNKVKYNKWFYGRDVQDDIVKKLFYPWCGAFVSWVYANAGFPLGNVGYLKGFAGCVTALKHFKDSGEIITKEQVSPGDIFIVDWQGDGKPDHTGIFLKDLGNGKFQTIEGNTAIGNDSNGGAVMVRERSYIAGKAIWYWIHPKVLDSPPITVL